MLSIVKKHVLQMQLSENTYFLFVACCMLRSTGIVFRVLKLSIVNNDLPLSCPENVLRL